VRPLSLTFGQQTAVFYSLVSDLVLRAERLKAPEARIVESVFAPPNHPLTPQTRNLR
jgi:hypothetical protein